MTETGKLIRDRRLRLNLSQKDVSIMAKCHVIQISQIELGVVGCPIPIAKRLARSLKLGLSIKLAMETDTLKKFEENWGK